ncbi:MAG TPA: hypothetical protein VGS41_01360 [Chthonomonadales bacterium]|nr:hypothetical protein [Chthonomonadales bacterium]
MGRRSGIILWTGVAAAAAGIVAVAAISRMRDNQAVGAGVASKMRDIKDVLADCYSKIHEIEARIPEIALEPPAVVQRGNGRARHTTRREA